MIKAKFHIDFLLPREEFKTAKEEEQYLYSLKKELEEMMGGKFFCRNVEVGYRFEFDSRITK